MMKKIPATLLITLLLLGFVLLRLYQLPQRIGFGSDEGRDFLVAWNIYVSKQPKLIGPPSEYGIQGREFYFGPAPYYVILPALILGKGSPVAVSYFLIFLNATGLLAVLWAINKYMKNKVGLCLFGLFYIVTPPLITYTQSYWNPYLMLPTATALLALLILSNYKKVSYAFSLIIGFLFGLGLEFHYGFIFAVVVAMIWLLAHKKLRWNSLAPMTVGFIVGFLPLLLFEIRNNFYNLNTLLLVLKNTGTSHVHFVFQIYYLISLFPFIIFFVSILLSKIEKKYTYLLCSGMALFVLWSMYLFLTKPSYMLNLPALIEIATIITHDNPSHYDIVDQMTRDNRALALRYILTVQTTPPLGVAEYPQAKTLYIYSPQPLNTLLVKPVWEIYSSGLNRLTKTWETSNGIKIYKLEK
jgi:hypothetical protein